MAGVGRPRSTREWTTLVGRVLGMEKGTSLIFNVRTSQSYSGTLPVNATVTNPGGGYTISDSVTAVYSMQVRQIPGTQYRY